MTYRDIATRQVLTWSAVAVGARMPVAVAPPAVVFLVRERPGGYSLEGEGRLARRAVRTTVTGGPAGEAAPPQPRVPTPS